MKEKVVKMKFFNRFKIIKLVIFILIFALALGLIHEWQTEKKAETMAKSSAIISRQSDYMLLARVVSGEARGEPYLGQVAVASVIINRTKSPKFPNTIPGVVYQPGAFE